MLIMHGGGPHPIWELKDYLHPIRSMKISMECEMERMRTPTLCDDVFFIERYEDWCRHRPDWSEFEKMRDSYLSNDEKLSI